MTPQELAQAMLGILAERGWGRGKLAGHDGKGKVCILGAAILAYSGRVTVAPLEEQVDPALLAPIAAMIHEQFPGWRSTELGIDQLWDFNDAPEHNLADIVLVLEKVRAL